MMMELYQQQQRSDFILSPSLMKENNQSSNNTKRKRSLKLSKKKIYNRLLIPLFIICGICYQIYRSIQLSLLIPNQNINNEISFISLSKTKFFGDKTGVNNRPQKSSSTRSASSSRNRLDKQQRYNNSNDNTKESKSSKSSKSSIPIIQKGFGVCMMLKDDNEILYEWLAYHYTMLPLIHLIIGNDIDIIQNPMNVLKRWNNIVSDFSYQIIQPNDFIHTLYGNYTKVQKRQYHFMLHAKKNMKKSNNNDTEDQEEEEGGQDEDEDEDEEDNSAVTDSNSTNSSDNNTTYDTNNTTTNTSTRITMDFPLLTKHQRSELTHKLLVMRQNTFINKCMEYMIYKNKQLNSGQEIVWVALIDTDEFIVLNRWDNDYDENLTIVKNNISLTGNYYDQPNITQKMYHIRKYHLPKHNKEHHSTVLYMIQNFTTKPKTKTITNRTNSSSNSIENDGTTSTNDNNNDLTIDIPTCYTMPRLLMSAIDNINLSACNESIPIQKWVYDNIPNRYQYMKTMRYFYHSGKGEFIYSKYGKVMIQLSDFTKHYMDLYNSTHIQKVIKRRKHKNVSIPNLLPKPYNIHRPYHDICGSPRTHFASSLYYIVHYIGTWEQYSVQRMNDLRRQSATKYNNKAFHNRGTICHVNYELHDWIYYFQNRLRKQQQILMPNATDNDVNDRVQELTKYLLGS